MFDTRDGNKEIVDICVVAPGTDSMVLERKALSLIRDDHWDIRVFELMPLYLKMAVIEEGVIVYAEDMYLRHSKMRR
ncbi:MAG: hypothetical protein WB392_05015 [Methanotrichaceae archaeon]